MVAGIQTPPWLLKLLEYLNEDDIYIKIGIINKLSKEKIDYDNLLEIFHILNSSRYNDNLLFLAIEILLKKFPEKLRFSDLNTMNLISSTSNHEFLSGMAMEIIAIRFPEKPIVSNSLISEFFKTHFPEK